MGKPWENNPPKNKRKKKRRRGRQRRPKRKRPRKKKLRKQPPGQKPQGPPGQKPPGRRQSPTSEIDEKDLPSYKKKRLLRWLLYAMVGTGVLTVITAGYFIMNYVM